MVTVNNNALPAPAVAPATTGPSSGAILANPSEGGALTLKELWQRLMRQKALFLTVLLSTLLLSALITWSIVPQFRAVSTLQIEKQGTQVVDFGELNRPTPDLGELDPFFRTQYEQLKSRELAQKVIEKLDLNKILFNKDFGTPLKTALAERAGTMFKPLADWIKSLGADDVLEKAAAKTDPVDLFLANLYVEPVEKRTWLKCFMKRRTRHYQPALPIHWLIVLSANR